MSRNNVYNNTRFEGIQVANPLIKYFIFCNLQLEIEIVIVLQIPYNKPTQTDLI